LTLEDDLTGTFNTDSTQTDIRPGSRWSSRNPIDVLVVDDSATVRQVLKELLSQERDISARVASDPIIALERMKQKRPDVIILDLEMPRMHGLTFLNKVMTEDPLPIVVCSGLAGSGTDEALRALEGGAVGIVTKPTLGIHADRHHPQCCLRATARPVNPVIKAERAHPGCRIHTAV
jgi:two-component system, chemotaxis family, protein-glutamate methylesterase/glutaminase